MSVCHCGEVGGRLPRPRKWTVGGVFPDSSARARQIALGVSGQTVVIAELFILSLKSVDINSGDDGRWRPLDSIA